MPILLRRPVRRAAFAAWCLGWLAVLAVTLRPQPDLPLELSDKTWHMLGFAAMTASAAGFARDHRVLLAAASWSLLMGAAVEIGQGFVPGRSPDLLDFAADALGVGLGLLLALVWLDVLVRPLRC